MARTRQKRKAKRREEQLKATRRSAAAKEKPMNPAEQAVIDSAEAIEIADELEEQIEDNGSTTTAPVEEAPVQERPERAERQERKERPREAKKPERRREPKPERRREARQRGRVTNFMVQVWAELRRVQWPDRNQVTQATGVVVVFCFLAGAYLALWDFVFSKVVTWLI
jgi:preprotein translocase subunit SecE